MTTASGLYCSASILGFRHYLLAAQIFQGYAPEGERGRARHRWQDEWEFFVTKGRKGGTWVRLPVRETSPPPSLHCSTRPDISNSRGLSETSSFASFATASEGGTEEDMPTSTRSTSARFSFLWKRRKEMEQNANSRSMGDEDDGSRTESQLAAYQRAPQSPSWNGQPDREPGHNLTANQKTYDELAQELTHVQKQKTDLQIAYDQLLSFNLCHGNEEQTHQLLQIQELHHDLAAMTQQFFDFEKLISDQDKSIEVSGREYGDVEYQMQEVVKVRDRLEAKVRELVLRIGRRNRALLYEKNLRKELEEWVKQKCMKADASTSKEPCYNRVCTHPNNAEDNQVPNAQSRGDIVPAAPRISPQTTTKSAGPLMVREDEISELSLGEPLLGIPANPATPPKATPTTLGYFQQPEYLASVREQLASSIDTIGPYGRKLLKEGIEDLSSSLCSQAETMNQVPTLWSPQDRPDPAEIQRVREQYENYNPVHEDQDQMMAPILRLAGLVPFPPAVVEELDPNKPPFSLPPPLFPLPHHLVIDELLAKVDKDAKILAKTRVYMRETAKEKNTDMQMIDNLREQNYLLERSLELHRLKDNFGKLRENHRRLREAMKE